MGDDKTPLQQWQHDLRGQLGTVMANVELGSVLGEEIDHPELAEVFARIGRAGERCTALLEQLGDVVKRGDS